VQALLRKTGNAATALQLSVKPELPPTVTVWLQVAECWQESLATHVRVTTSGHKEFVAVLTTLIVTPLPATPADGQHQFVAEGGSKFHCAPHCTVLFEAQSKAKFPVTGEVTVNITVHCTETLFGSVIVIVML
jgi:hypothetical protein